MILEIHSLGCVAFVAAADAGMVVEVYVVLVVDSAAADNAQVDIDVETGLHISADRKWHWGRTRKMSPSYSDPVLDVDVDETHYLLLYCV